MSLLDPIWPNIRQYIWGGLMMFLGGAVLLALLTYAPTDASLDTAARGVTHNWMGPPGAATADLLWQIWGLPSLLLALAFVQWGWRVMQLGSLPWWQLKLSALVLMLAFGSGSADRRTRLLPQP